jgi:hypothetical protein
MKYRMLYCLKFEWFLERMLKYHLIFQKLFIKIIFLIRCDTHTEMETHKAYFARESEHMCGLVTLTVDPEF